MKLLGHGALILGGLFLLLGVPFLATDYGQNFIKTGGMDTVSSASTILDAPSGQYVIFINNALHTEEKLSEWETFFSGGDITYIFEDISCSVSSGDAGAIEMAQSLQSRLPENQMSLQKEDQTLLLSRAENGKFDVLIMSVEFVEANLNLEDFLASATIITIEGES